MLRSRVNEGYRKEANTQKIHSEDYRIFQVNFHAEMCSCANHMIHHVINKFRVRLYRNYKTVNIPEKWFIG